MHSLSIFGTSSDAGKSTIAFALTYLLHKKGIKVTPFKAQNVSNNSKVTDDNGEIAVPQAFAAEAIGLKTTYFMNPVLLKSGSNSQAHIIINGKTIKNGDVWTYYRDINSLKPAVKQAFKKLQKEYDMIVAEGAGSPVELNLMQKDLSNIYVAKEFNTKIILVADIEKGGVFASIYGVYNLLPKKLRKNIIGVIINKFRGNLEFFDKGKTIIEKKFGLKVLGVVPFKPFNLGFEDSQSINNYKQNSHNITITIGVIQLPHISNFTDFEPLVLDDEIYLKFITHSKELDFCDVVVLPGSKLVVEDLLWLRKNGFEPYLQDKSKVIIAICGGYEMMFEKLIDNYGVESDIKETKGFARFRGEVSFQKEKTLKKGSYNLFDVIVEGYEIHNATAKKKAKYKKNIYGTFVHGIFESDELRYRIFSDINPSYKGYDFKKRKKSYIEDFTKHIEKYIDMSAIHKEIF